MKNYFSFFLVLCLSLTISLTVQAFEEVRYFTQEIKEGDRLTIDTGAGSLILRQKDDIEEIKIEAVIRLQKLNDREVQEILEDNLQLFLERRGNNLYFKSDFNGDFLGVSEFLSFLFSGVSERSIDVIIETPYISSISIDDGSGSTLLEGIESELDLDDGSGDIEVLNCTGSWYIDDNSGNIYVDNFHGQLKIEDGSGDIDIRKSLVDITLDDGSGNISMEGINGHLNIEDNSGDIRIDNLSKSIEIDDGSGDIILRNVGGDVTIWEAGSGDVRLNNISGQVKNYDD